MKFSINRIALLSLLFLSSFSFAQNGGEDCGSAVNIPGVGPSSPVCVDPSTETASDDFGGEIGCATQGGGNGHRDVWYTFTATETTLDFTLTNVDALATAAMEFNLFTGACGSLTQVFSDCAAAGAAGNSLTSQFNGLTIGTTYTILISTSNGNSGDGEMDLCIDNIPTPVAPPNDLCSGAISLTPDGSCTAGYLNTATQDNWTGEPGCATTGTAATHLDVWYSFVATDGVVDLTVNSLGINGTELEIVLVSSQGVPCVDAWNLLTTFCGPAPLTGTYAGLTPGNTYYYTVSAPNSTVGDFETCVDTYGIPNDDCAGAIPVTVGTGGLCTEVEGSNIGATATGGVPAPGCSSYGGGDVWFSITVPASGNVTFSTDYAASNSLNDIAMEIYYGPCGSLTSIDCDDDSGTGLLPDIQTTGLTPGATVYIRVWDYGNDDQGAFDLCISEPAAILSNQDCVTALPICSDANFGGSSNGDGSVTDLQSGNDDCLFGENQSSWLYMEISSPGDFMFTITPDNGTDDYDFILWKYPGGIGSVCPPADGTADRCSYGAGAGANGSYDTGLDDGTTVSPAPTDNSETASGDNWVQEINVVAGDAIMLMIDNFSSTTSPYTLDFTGTAGLDCSVLPTELMTYYVVADENNKDNSLHWKTLSEINNDFFTIQHSVDGEAWETIGTVEGVGNSNEQNHYGLKHLDAPRRINYYRLSQTDFDGTESNFKVVSINNSLTGKQVVMTTNLVGQEVDHTYKGLVIDVYEDGSSVKRIQM